MRRLLVAALLVSLPLVGTSVLTAGNTVPATGLYNGARSVTPVTEFRPAECAGPYTTLYSGGTNTGSSGADLMFGTGGADIVRGSGGNDCLVGGGGPDTVNGGSGTDVCIVGVQTLAANVSGCETLVRRP